MSRRPCPELYPDPRPSRLLVPLLPYLPSLHRLLPWMTAAPAIAGVAVLMVAALPLLTWALLSAAVFAPLVVGMALFSFGWE